MNIFIPGIYESDARLNNLYNGIGLKSFFIMLIQQTPEQITFFRAQKPN